MNKATTSDFKLVSELDFAKFYLNPSGDTLMVSYLPSTDLNLSMAKQVIDVAYPFAEQGAFLGITDATAQYLNISTEARKYYRDNKANDLNKAHAVVVNSLATRMLANFFTHIDKPTMPLKVFNDFQSAINWLEKYK